MCDSELGHLQSLTVQRKAKHGKGNKELGHEHPILSPQALKYYYPLASRTWVLTYLLLPHSLSVAGVQDNVQDSRVHCELTPQAFKVVKKTE